MKTQFKKAFSVLLLSALHLSCISIAVAQTDTLSNGKVSIGGYGQIDFNKPIKQGERSNATLDVHRMVLLFGYQYNSRLSFLTELEFEHVSEVYVEQAILNYSFSPMLNLKAGLLLIPMGIINEYHEPPTFNGVERPLLDNRIVPSTWRELGAGFSGYIQNANINYQIYVVNGFSSYSKGAALLNGSDGLRKGRQKGAESYMSSPNLSVKLTSHSIPGLELGVSGYFGKTQSTLYNGISSNNTISLARADSSVVNVSMLSGHYLLNKKSFRSRGQLVYTSIGNTLQYNQFTGKDLGNAMMGYYAELSYIFPITLQGNRNEIEPFIRWEQYNTHFNVDTITEENKTNAYQGLVLGMSYRFHKNATLKGDYILFRKGNENLFQGVLNLGVGVSF